MKHSEGELQPIKVVSYGIGVIGRRLARHMLSKAGLKIVGAVDINPKILGRDLGEVLGLKKLGLRIQSDVDKVIQETSPDIVLHTTTSYLKDTYEQLMQILNHGVNIISTCEELSYPYANKNGSILAERLNQHAKSKGATLLGTGINPGFLMDTLPIVLTGVCTRIDEIIITRQMNAATRRIPFQVKIGAGLTLNEFKEKIEQKEISGHVGLEQSIQMIANAVGWVLDDIKVESVNPVILKQDVASDTIMVPKGFNAGSMQKAYGIIAGNKVITLDFRAYIGASEEFDSIVIKGEPPINEKISPCVHGDYGTIAIASNMIPHVINAEPGLKTMKDLPIPHATVAHMKKYIS